MPSMLCWYCWNNMIMAQMCPPFRRHMRFLKASWLRVGRFDALSFKSAFFNDAETHLLAAQILSLTINPKNGRKVLLKVMCVELSYELWQSECWLWQAYQHVSLDPASEAQLKNIPRSTWPVSSVGTEIATTMGWNHTALPPSVPNPAVTSMKTCVIKA